MEIVLHNPEIPQNTGNIGRTCAATGSALHLIEPLGFRINEKMLKRAGMDYWEALDVRRHINLEAYRADYGKRVPKGRVWMATTKAKRLYTDVVYEPADAILFGAESCGIPEAYLNADEAHCIRIPMLGETRSLNLSNAVAIVLYEALRQQGFDGLF